MLRPIAYFIIFFSHKFFISSTSNFLMFKEKNQKRSVGACVSQCYVADLMSFRH